MEDKGEVSKVPYCTVRFLMINETDQYMGPLWDV